jgi:hypothetical protein
MSDKKTESTTGSDVKVVEGDVSGSGGENKTGAYT